MFLDSVASPRKYLNHASLMNLFDYPSSQVIQITAGNPTLSCNADYVLFSLSW